MLAHLAIHTPKPKRIDDLIASMQRLPRPVGRRRTAGSPHDA
jgi:hypothetical protein